MEDGESIVDVMLKEGRKLVFMTAITSLFQVQAFLPVYFYKNFNSLNF